LINPTPQPTRSGPPTATPVVCSFAGSVTDKDTNQPLFNVEISYFRFTQDSTPYQHSIRSHLATSGPDGRFEADCSQIERENFPLRLQLSRSNWCSTMQTDEYVQPGTRRTAINLFASDQTLSKLGCS
jgi:hypothetical protein